MLHWSHQKPIEMEPWYKGSVLCCCGRWDSLEDLLKQTEQNWKLCWQFSVSGYSVLCSLLYQLLIAAVNVAKPEMIWRCKTWWDAPLFRSVIVWKKNGYLLTASEFWPPTDPRGHICSTLGACSLSSSARAESPVLQVQMDDAGVLRSKHKAVLSAW